MTSLSGRGILSTLLHTWDTDWRFAKIICCWLFAKAISSQNALNSLVLMYAMMAIAQHSQSTCYLKHGQLHSLSVILQNSSALLSFTPDSFLISRRAQLLYTFSSKGNIPIPLHNIGRLQLKTPGTILRKPSYWTHASSSLIIESWLFCAQTSQV